MFFGLNILLIPEREFYAAEYILKYCPELKKSDKKSLHDPARIEPDVAAKEKYPKPIIELNVNRDKVMKAYKQVANKN
jgi:deoxyribodipyrimidine photolyase